MPPTRCHPFLSRISLASRSRGLTMWCGCPTDPTQISRVATLTNLKWRAIVSAILPNKIKTLSNTSVVVISTKAASKRHLSINNNRVLSFKRVHSQGTPEACLLSHKLLISLNNLGLRIPSRLANDPQSSPDSSSSSTINNKAMRAIALSTWIETTRRDLTMIFKELAKDHLLLSFLRVIVIECRSSSPHFSWRLWTWCSASVSLEIICFKFYAL